MEKEEEENAMQKMKTTFRGSKSRARQIEIKKENK